MQVDDLSRKRGMLKMILMEVARIDLKQLEVQPTRGFGPGDKNGKKEVYI